MSIEELKLMQSNIIKKNKKCNLIGMIIIGIIMGISIVVTLLCSMKFYYIIIILFLELIFSIITLSIIKYIVNGKDIKIFKEKFDKEIKGTFVLKLFRQFFENLDYNFEKGFSEEDIQNYGMLYTGDRFYSNDYISGTYKNIKFEQSDIQIEVKNEEKDEEGNKKIEWDTIFMGKLMIFEFNKEFKADVQVLSRYFAASTLPWNKLFSKVKMEDIEFNKSFVVYANNEHDAFYILTPQFMEKIKAITKKLNCSVMFGFSNNKLHIAINNYEDSFEYSIFEPINEKKIEENIVENIKLITNFVDELNLDNDLFKSKS